jgi:hypothetical protein
MPSPSPWQLKVFRHYFDPWAKFLEKLATTPFQVGELLNFYHRGLDRWVKVRRVPLKLEGAPVGQL